MIPLDYIYSNDEEEVLASLRRRMNHTSTKNKVKVKEEEEVKEEPQETIEMVTTK